MKNPGIYRFINNRTGEVYVGQSFNVYARRGKHHKELAMGTHHNKGMQEDHNRGDAFTFEVLEKMPNASREELEEREIYYIDKFNSFYEGYNQTPGGEYDQYKGSYEYGGDRLPPHKYKPVPKPKLLDACPECGGELVKRKGKYSSFAGCINYPKCTFSCSLKKVNLKSKKKSISDESNIPKDHIIQSSVEWGTCSHCGKKIYRVASVCPYCNELLEEPKTTVKIPKVKHYTVKPKKALKTDFEKFVTKKHNYLTKADCDYLAAKYNIDISNITTVKKANPIIKKYLNKNNQWEIAMEELYKHNNPSIQTDNNDTIDTFNQKSNNTSSLNTDDSEKNINLDNEPTQNESTTKIVNYYSYWNNKVHIEKESSSDKATIKKSNPNNNIKSSNSSTTHESVRYCSNCGSKIDLNDDYCWNCGEKTDNNNIKHKSKSSKDSGDSNWATALLVIIIIIFIISFVIVSSGAEGPISTIAAVIFVGILCFGCYASSQ